MDIKVALKNALGTIQTPTTAANYGATDLVPLFDSNDQLIGKISRNELMSAVKTSLGTLLNQGAANLGTSLAKIPALNSGGTLGSATVANLASVLGGAYQGRIGGSSGAIDLNDVTSYGAYGIGSGGDWANISHKPEDANNAGTLFVVQGSVEAWKTQIVILQGGKAYYRNIYPNAQYNTSWVRFSTDIPDFYKNYADLAALANALGIGFQERIIPANSYLDYNIKEVAIFTVCISSDVFAICLNNLGKITILGDKFHLLGTTSGFTYVITGGASGKTFSIQNNSGSSVKTQITQLGYTRSWVQ